ncbi:hypothetical protein ECDEC14C_1715 [Escherichia coli DEC14C]|nr:hypothetical protein ECDEC14C_1715 [Escherichia coli DEC14C]
MRYPLFCTPVFNGFFKEFIFHRFFAEQALEFFNLLHGSSKFRGRNDLLSCGHSSRLPPGIACAREITGWLPHRVAGQQGRPSFPVQNSAEQ